MAVIPRQISKMESEILKILEEEEKELKTRFNELMNELQQSSIHGNYFSHEITDLVNEIIDVNKDIIALKVTRSISNTYNKGGEKDDE